LLLRKTTITLSVIQIGDIIISIIYQILGRPSKVEHIFSLQIIVVKLFTRMELFHKTNSGKDVWKYNLKTSFFYRLVHPMLNLCFYCLKQYTWKPFVLHPNVHVSYENIKISSVFLYTTYIFSHVVSFTFKTMQQK
jgi:hypothetical protein